MNGHYFFFQDVVFNENVHSKIHFKTLQPISETTPMVPLSTTQLSTLIVQTSLLLISLFEIPTDIEPPSLLNVSTSNLNLSTQPCHKIIMTDAGQVFFDDMHKKNECLLKLCADCQAQLLLHQGLSAILDLDTFYNTVDFLTLILDLTSLEIPAINDYKVYAAHGLDTPRFKTTKPINLDKASENFYEATHHPDADI